MAGRHHIAIDGTSFEAPHGAILLDAALSSGIDVPYDCRAGHCGTCCVRLVSGEVHGGQASEAGMVHACQCRIVADAVIERDQPPVSRNVDGRLTSLRALSRDVVEIGIATDGALPYLAGQYAQVRFSGYPSRPFSITHPLVGQPDDRTVWFHVRPMKDGRVTPELGTRISRGHRVRLTGPFGKAHFRSNPDARIVLVSTSTGFAPIWSIAIAALRENPSRMMMVIVGGRSLEALYMGQALARLARFPNVVVMPVCSSLQTPMNWVRPGRPTDVLPRLLPTDVVYACGAPEMVAAVRSITTRFGAVCYADPFVPTGDETADTSGSLRKLGRFVWPTTWSLAKSSSIVPASGGDSRLKQWEWLRQS